MDINVPLFHSYSRFEIRKNCRRSNAQLRMIKVATLSSVIQPLEQTLVVAICGLLAMLTQTLTKPRTPSLEVFTNLPKDTNLALYKPYHCLRAAKPSHQQT